MERSETRREGFNLQKNITNIDRRRMLMRTHFVLDSSKNLETIGNNERYPSRQTRPCCHCGTKTGLIYELLVKR